MNIFVAADPELPVPPALYGGIERVIALLVNGLAARGHDVTLFAHPDSNVECRLVPYRGRRSGSRADTARNAATIVGQVLRGSPDVVHNFGRLAYLLPLLPARLPKVMSYQRAVTPRSIANSRRLSAQSLSFVACSRQLAGRFAEDADWRVIYNAVPVDRYRFTEAVPAGAPLAFLGRIEPIKGTHVAIEVARRAGRRLVIAGNVPSDPEHERYFRERIAPLVDGDRVKYIGQVDDRAKSDLLSTAAALLMPIQWDEPFGIVMAEALACGTPVIGLARGSVPEVIADAVTGFVCADEDAMVFAVSKLKTLRRRDCRAAAEARFSQPALVDAHEALYKEVMHGRRAERVATVAPVNTQ